MRFPALVFSTFLLATMVATIPASASCSTATLKGVYGYYHGRPGVVRRLLPSLDR